MMSSSFKKNFIFFEKTLDYECYNVIFAQILGI